jgi:hypothetical protein
MRTNQITVLLAIVLSLATSNTAQDIVQDGFTDAEVDAMAARLFEIEFAAAAEENIIAEDEAGSRGFSVANTVKKVEEEVDTAVVVNKESLVDQESGSISHTSGVFSLLFGISLSVVFFL